jgi:hypothetical protein
MDARIRAQREAEPFVLDLSSNPHPRLLALALKAKHAYEADRNIGTERYYLGVIHACAAATGCQAFEMVRWVEHHEARQ